VVTRKRSRSPNRTHRLGANRRRLDVVEAYEEKDFNKIIEIMERVRKRVEIFNGTG
jgi:hypothetical protein